MKTCKIELMFNSENDKIEDIDFTYWYEPNEFSIQDVENACSAFKAAVYKAGVGMRWDE